MTDEAKLLVELQKAAGLKNLPTPLTHDLRIAVSGEGPRAYDWQDKPHRLLYDACAEIETQAREIERLREALSKANEAHWFYYGNDCSSEQCRFSIHECIDEDFEWDNRPVGDHVLQIAGARPVPDMWVALHYFTEAEMDERQDDEPYTYTVHATEEEARAALAGDSYDA